MPVSFTCIAYVIFYFCFSSIDVAQCVEPHKYGSVARIVVNGKHKCGATVLSRYWVLTAAHCLTGVKYSETKIVVGDHKLSELDVSEQEVNAKQFIIHQGYDKSNQLHDIAVILVYPAIEFSSNVTCANTPVCGKPINPEGAVVGWGKYDVANGDPSDELKDGIVNIISGDECLKKLPQIPNAKYVICAEGNTCAGDTGGPIFLIYSAVYQEQVGVYSYSDGGCDTGVTAFTKISEYTSWIERRTSGCGNFPFFPESHVRK